MSTPAAERPSAVDRTPAGEIADRGGIAGHPRGLTTLFFTEMWERFSYYGMRALLILFMTASVADGGLGLETSRAAAIYGMYTAAVYFTAIPGGWIADRLLGQRDAVLYGGILIALGHFSLALNVTPLFYAGLVLIVLGTGLLKTNVSTIVGQLYAPDDRRRDAGFSIFYMGINLGGFIAPLVCGYLGQRIGWHWGFGAAGVGMTLGLIQYVMGSARLGTAGLLERQPTNAGMLWAGVAAISLVVVAAFYALWDYRDLVLLAGTAALFVWLLGQSHPGVERRRMLAILVLFVFSTLFWAGFEQVGSSLNLFADRATRNSAFGWDFPSSYFQSLNSFFIVAFAPVFAWLWIRLSSREPSSPAKFAWGLAFVSLGFVTVATAALISQQSDGARVSPIWLTLVFLFFTFGELALSPVGLSTVTKLAPQRLVGTMMGVWFLSISLGNFFGGRVAGLFETFPLPKLFGAVALTTGASALLLALLVKPIRKLMSGVH
ncbi:MAG TPA: peptide MFS transporter [Vicinamibacterales bacterium]|jgi:POT family proton-dependent oligopeptide transporter|nr:peptide MFS transporter [Vicinamibacterales bacterium]